MDPLKVNNDFWKELIAYFRFLTNWELASAGTEQKTSPEVPVDIPKVLR